MWKILLLGILVAGCMTEGDMQPAPPATAPVLDQPRQLTKGEALYIRHCSGCHGWEGRGDGPVARVVGVHPPSLRRPQLYGRTGEAEMVAWILFGDAFLPLPDPAKIASTEAELSALMAHLRRLPQIDWEKVEKGREAYDSLCAYCHGVYGRGDGILASAQATPPRDLSAPAFRDQTSDEELFRVISQGKGKMAATKEALNEEEIRSVIAYLRVLSPGYELYESFCAACHGSDGFPPAIVPDEIFGIPPLSEKDLPRVGFDEDYFREHPESTVRLWARHMYKANRSLMPHFGAELKGSDIRKIVGYLRALPPET